MKTAREFSLWVSSTRPTVFSEASRPHYRHKRQPLFAGLFFVPCNQIHTYNMLLFWKTLGPLICFSPRGRHILLPFFVIRQKNSFSNSQRKVSFFHTHSPHILLLILCFWYFMHYRFVHYYIALCVLLYPAVLMHYATLDGFIFHVSTVFISEHLGNENYGDTKNSALHLQLIWKI